MSKPDEERLSIPVILGKYEYKRVFDNESARNASFQIIGGTAVYVFFSQHELYRCRDEIFSKNLCRSFMEKMH